MPSASPLISLTIPTFNRCDTLEQTLRTLLPHCTDPSLFEILVCDNASTDRTPVLLSQPPFSTHPTLRLVRHPTNIGGEENMRQAFTLARGKYLKYLNDNVLVSEAFFPRLLAAAALDPSIILHVPAAAPEHREVRSFDALLGAGSYYVTWLSGIAVRRDCLSPERLARIPSGTQLLPMMLLFAAFETHPHGIVLFSPDFTGIEPKRKGGYDLGQVFIRNYLHVLGTLRIRGLVSHWGWLRAKTHLLVFFLYPWFLRANILYRTQSPFRGQEFFPRLLEHFAFNPILYLMPLYALLRVFRWSWKLLLTGKKRRLRDCF